MAKAIENFLFGLCFGMGFAVAQVVLAFIVSLLAGGIHHGGYHIVCVSHTYFFET